jgi:hypothetical protein
MPSLIAVGESLAELTRAFGNVVRKRLESIFRQPPQVRQPRRH